MAETERKLLPPYLPYKTFTTFIEHLRVIGLPSHIDRDVMRSMSGGMQSWLRSGLRYLKLINGDDTPTDALERLVSAPPENRKEVLLRLFNDAYGFLNGKVDLKNTTPSKLRAAIVEQGAQGETVEKIVAFLVAMAKDAGVQLSPLLTKRAAGPRRPRAKKDGRLADQRSDADDEEDIDDGGETRAMKTIALPKSGGTLTLSGNLNVFELVGAERDLVFALIDAMRKFEDSQGGGEP